MRLTHSSTYVDELYLLVLSHLPPFDSTLMSRHANAIIVALAVCLSRQTVYKHIMSYSGIMHKQLPANRHIERIVEDVNENLLIDSFPSWIAN